MTQKCAISDNNGSDFRVVIYSKGLPSQVNIVLESLSKTHIIVLKARHLVSGLNG